MTSKPSNPATVAAIAIVAFALCDMVHEVLGHGTATLASPAVRATLLTTVALSTEGTSRLVAAAGTIANLAAAALSFLWLKRRAGAPSWQYFLWLFGSLNLFNATGYFLYSGILGSGDWAVVIAGLKPYALWRGAMIAVGAASYVASVAASARSLSCLVSAGTIGRADVSRLCALPYWIGSTLLVLGAVPNPVSPWLILTSGASSGFGAMAGLLFVPPRAAASPPADAPPAHPLGQSRGWAVAGVLTACVFIFVVGRGIRLS